MLGKEVTVLAASALPQGYTFVPKGDPYVTRHCRQQTLQSGHDVQVVPGGLRCPKSVVRQVRADSLATRATRAAAVAEKDRKDKDAAKSVIARLFPRMPGEDVKKVLEHAFKKRSGRVGRTGTVSIDRRVLLAVTAHVRHVHTGYDTLLRRGGQSRQQVRALIHNQIQQVLRSWGPISKGGAPLPANSAEPTASVRLKEDSYEDFILSIGSDGDTSEGDDFDETVIEDEDLISDESEHEELVEDYFEDGELGGTDHGDEDDGPRSKPGGAPTTPTTSSIGHKNVVHRKTSKFPSSIMYNGELIEVVDMTAD
ncbi:hypothetical protein MBLNU230_g4443t1 [Neophaeotheca triangularis]